MLRPLGDHILVKPGEAEETTASGIVLPDTAQKRPREGEVLAVGAGKLLENGQRAVARGCATNKVSLLIPCHRIVRSDGGLGGYRWGLKRKQRLLAMESDRFGAKETGSRDRLL